MDVNRLHECKSRGKLLSGRGSKKVFAKEPQLQLHQVCCRVRGIKTPRVYSADLRQLSACMDTRLMAETKLVVLWCYVECR